MIAYLVVSSFLISLLSLFFFWAVLLKKNLSFKGPNLAFCLFSFSIFWWSSGHMMWLLSQDEQTALLWLRVLVVGSTFIPFAYFHFVICLTERLSLIRYAVFGYLIAFILSIFEVNDFMVSGVEQRMSFPFWPVPGPMFLAYVGSYGFMALLGVGLLANAYRSVGAEKKNQLRYVLIGTGVGFAGGSTNFFLWLDIPIEPFGHAAVIFYILGLGYSMLKFRTLDFSEMAFRVLGLIALAILASGLLSFGLVLLLDSVYPDFYPNSFLFWWAILGILSLSHLVFGPSVSLFFNQFLHERFLAKRFAYRAGLQELSAEIRIGGTLSEYYEKVLQRLSELLQLSSAGLYILAEGGLDYECKSKMGDRNWLPAIRYENLANLMNLFIQKNGAYSVSEIRFSKDGNEMLSGTLNKLIEQDDIIVPVYGGKNVLGFLILGRSQLRPVLADLDILLLENICSQLGLMLVFRELERKSNQVEKLVSLGTMAAGLSHELRNPLVSVQTLVSILNRSDDAGSISSDFKATLTRDVKRIQGILEGISAFSRNSDGHMKYLVIDEAIEEALQLVSEKAALSNVEIVLKPSQSEICMVADYDQLIQVFQNLFDNAINAIVEWSGRPDQGRVEVETVVRSIQNQEAPHDLVKIIVSDNGPGVPDNVRTAIFDPFVTSRDTGLRSGYAGSGLGLAIVSKIIERHHGMVRVDSPPVGSGAVFRISLPITHKKP